jgi:DNA-binding response OmpR family regulator
MAEQKHILVIDDDRGTLRTMQARLEQEGYDVLIADDGLAGLETARNKRPDLIILDVMLPRLNGYKICRFLKYDESFKHIPIIMVSAKSDQSEVDLGMEVGADLYITKPFEPDALMEQVHSQLGMTNLL